MSATRLPIAVAALTIIASPALARQDFAAYEGRDAIQEGVGGAKVSKHGIDYWTNGTPPRRFQLLGFITDKRRDSGLVPDIIGSKGVAKEALKQGDTAVIVLDSREKLKGISNSASAYAAGQGINASGFSAARSVGEGKGVSVRVDLGGRRILKTKK